MSSITFLGTGTSQGVPMIGCRCSVCQSTNYKDKRLRSSVYIEHEGVKIVIDSSMDFRYQMLRENICEIDAIIFTHGHKDHTGGLDDVRAYNYILDRDMHIYGEQRALDVIYKDFDYAFAKKKYPGVPNIVSHLIDETPFYIKGIKIVPIRGLHHKLPVLGYRIGDICYITDMNHIELAEIAKFRGVKILVINALRHKEHISHFTLSQALEVISLAKPQKSYLTHISHQLGLHDEINATLPHGVEAAYDTLKITI